MRKILALLALLTGATPVLADWDTQPIQGVTAMTVGTAYATTRYLLAVCTAAGNATLIFNDGTSAAIPVVVGYNSFNFSVTQVSAQTATCSYYRGK